MSASVWSYGSLKTGQISAFLATADQCRMLNLRRSGSHLGLRSSMCPASLGGPRTTAHASRCVSTSSLGSNNQVDRRRSGNAIYPPLGHSAVRPERVRERMSGTTLMRRLPAQRRSRRFVGPSKHRSRSAVPANGCRTHRIKSPRGILMSLPPVRGRRMGSKFEFDSWLPKKNNRFRGRNTTAAFHFRIFSPHVPHQKFADPLPA